MKLITIILPSGESFGSTSRSLPEAETTVREAGFTFDSDPIKKIIRIHPTPPSTKGKNND